MASHWIIYLVFNLTSPVLRPTKLKGAGPPDGYSPPPVGLSALALSPASASSILSEHVIVRLIYSLSDPHSTACLLSDASPTSFSIFPVSETLSQSFSEVCQTTSFTFVS